MVEVRMTTGNIAEVDCECIVNSAKPTLKEGAGVCGAIFKAAGRLKLAMACSKLGGCNVGEAKITDGFKLKAKKIIHTVAPEDTGNPIEEMELMKCYINSLRVARYNRIKEICFPLIGAGVRHFSVERAYELAYEAINSWSNSNTDYDMKILFCLDRDTYLKVSARMEL